MTVIELSFIDINNQAGLGLVQNERRQDLQQQEIVWKQLN